MIGPFANTTLIRTRFDADLSFQEALDRVRDAGLGGLRQAGTSLRYHCRPAGGRRRSGSSITHSSLFRAPERVSPAAQAARCGGPTVRLSGRAVAVMPIDRTWLRMSSRRHRRELLAHADTRTTCSSQTSPALDRGLQDDLGQSGRKPRDVARPVGRSLKMRSDVDHASQQKRRVLHGSMPVPRHAQRVLRSCKSLLPTQP